MRNGLLKRWIVDRYHRIWYDEETTWRDNTFLGFGVMQNPSDLWLYQELIHRLRPESIVQTGVWKGGSIFYFAHLLDLIGAPAEAKVVGVDISLSPEARKILHPRVHLIEGSSIDVAVVNEVRGFVNPERPVLVVLDSDHSEKHVHAEMLAYREFVPVGSYMVVEDTNVNGHPVVPSFGPGPFEAVERYLQNHDDFERDDALWQRQLFSLHQYGWLRRARTG
jgi:cephalosporin hydroxylase